MTRTMLDYPVPDQQHTLDSVLADEVAGRICLTVVLPALNEAKAVGNVVREVQAALADWPNSWEVVVIDDGSQDGTGEAAAKAGAIVIRRPEAGGYGAALKAGIRHARGEWVAVLDADGSYDPAALPSLLNLLPAYDQVNGARNQEYGRLATVRRFAKWSITKLAEWISAKRIIDLNTGMKVFKRDLAMDFLWALPQGFSAVSSLTLAFLCDGHLVAYVPVPYRPRVGKSKFHPIVDTLRYVTTIFRLILYFRPLRVFLPVAGVLALVAMPIATWHVIRSPTGLHDVDILLFACVALTVVCGLLAELIVAQRRGRTGN